MGKKSNTKRNATKSAVNIIATRKILPTKKRKQLDRFVDELLSAVLVEIPNTDTLWDVYISLYRILNKINLLEAEVDEPTPMKDRKVAIDDFMSWAKDNGVNPEGVEISEFTGYDLGLKATKPFAAGSTILTIPRKLMLTEDCAKKSILGNLIANDPLLKFMPNVTLAMYLLLKKFTDNSFWKPYIDVLPTTYNTVLYFTPEEFLELRGSPAFRSSIKFYLDITRQYAYFYKLLQNSVDPVAHAMKHNFTYKEYCWAASTIMTRLNIVPSENNCEAVTTALIPLWDMCNHTSGEITTNFDPDLDQAECFALHDFKPGEQIFIFYGIRTNVFFFLHNGFVFPENEHDTLAIIIGISPNDPLQALKKELLDKLGLTGATVFYLENKKIPITAGLMAFSRIFVMDKEELTSWISGGHHGELMTNTEGANIKPELDKKAYNFIQMRCSLLIGSYKKQNNTEFLAKLELADNGNEKRPAINEKHRDLTTQLKECEIKLLQKTVDYTKTKL